MLQIAHLFFDFVCLFVCALLLVFSCSFLIVVHSIVVNRYVTARCISRRP